MNPLNKIGIIGLGLIGGSIAKSLKRQNRFTEIASLERPCRDLQGAIDQKAVDKVFKNWGDLLLWSDIIILASPLSPLSALAEEIVHYCPKDKQLLVIDVGSVKKAVFPAFETLTNENIEFLSTHPMAGKERWGFAHSDASLFDGCCWILSPHCKNRSESLQKVSSLIESLGARACVLSPQKHDEQVALISHLPALVSRFLLQYVQIKDPDALKIAGPGFESMTRLAKDNPMLQNEIYSLNKEELAKQMHQWLEFAFHQSNALEEKNP